MSKQIVKNILTALAVAVFGFILLNLTFLFDFLFQSLIDIIVKLFTTADINLVWPWYPPVKHIIFIVIIGLISWPILRSKLRVLFKAIYLTVPLAVVFASIGMFLYRWPAAVYSLGIIFTIAILYYLYRTKQLWLYFYTVILVGLVMAIMTLMGVDI